MPKHETKGDTNSQANLFSQYKEMKMQTNKYYQDIYPHVRGSTKNKPIVLSYLDQMENILNLVIIQPMFKQAKPRQDYKAS